MIARSAMHASTLSETQPNGTRARTRTRGVRTFVRNFRNHPHNMLARAYICNHTLTRTHAQREAMLAEPNSV